MYVNYYHVKSFWLAIKHGGEIVSTEYKRLYWQVEVDLVASLKPD